MCEVALLTLPGSPSTQHVHIHVHVEASKNMPTWQNVPQVHYTLMHHCVHCTAPTTPYLSQNSLSSLCPVGERGEVRVLPA